MGDRDAIDGVWSRLRVAAAGSDPGAAVAAIPAAIEVGLLQAAVSVAVAALRNSGSAEVALDRLVDALRDRAWDGDDLAIEVLQAARSGASTGRTEILADLDALGDVLGQQLGGYLERATGEAWAASIFEDGGVDAIDPDQWMYLPGDTHDAWQDMATFANDVADPHIRELLELAIQGRGAFSRFRAVLDRHPTYWIDWRVWSSERATGRARAWLATQGYDPAP